MSHAAQVDVLVAGGGPGGLCSAALLAEGGLNVVLVDRESPEAVDHDLLVTAPAADFLRSWVPEPSLKALSRPLPSLSVHFGNQRRRDFDDFDGMAIADRALRDLLVERAVRAGVDLRLGHVDQSSRHDLGWKTTLVDGHQVNSRHLVWATGTQPGTSPGEGAAAGRGHIGAQSVVGVTVDPSGAHLILPSPSSFRIGAGPANVWALPAAQTGTATLGVAWMGDAKGQSPEDLMQFALSALREVPELSTTALEGRPRWAPLDFGFQKARLVDSPGLTIGAAAGLANPFTGDGISYALESASLAAKAILSTPHDAEAAQRAYRRQASAAFVGYVETARHASRRYHVMWRTLSSAANNDSPFFEKGRRAVLLPTGLAGATSRSEIRPSDPLLALRPFLLACDEIMISTIRDQWPFLARATARGEGVSDRRIRPAILFAGAASTSGPLDSRLAPIAAAIELTWLGTLAFIDTRGGAKDESSGIDWAVTGAVIAGDFLLAQASRIVAESAPEVSWAFAEWLMDIVRCRVAQRQDPELSAVLFSTLFEFPARIGAHVAGASPEVISELREVGAAIGRCFLHAEEVLALQGRRTRLDTNFETMVSTGLTALPLEDGSERDHKRARSLDVASRRCRAAEDEALQIVNGLAAKVSREMLGPLVRAVAKPAR